MVLGKASQRLERSNIRKGKTSVGATASVRTSRKKPSLENQRKNLESKSNHESVKRQWRKEDWTSLGLLLGLAVGLLLFFHFFLPHQVTGVSMAPTLSDKQRILIAKKSVPKRYDIVTFHPESEPEDSYVKRVIGLPGDGLWLMDEQTLIIKEGAAFTDLEKASRQLPEFCSKYSLSLAASDQLASFEVIPANTCFVVGDNRKNSADSRLFGLVSTSQLEGVVVGRYFPFRKWGRVS